jgi:hypothetical protein
VLNSVLSLVAGIAAAAVGFVLADAVL